MGNKEHMVDNRYLRRTGHLCKEVIMQAGGMTSSHVLIIKENFFCLGL